MTIEQERINELVSILIVVEYALKGERRVPTGGKGASQSLLLWNMP